MHSADSDVTSREMLFESILRPFIKDIGFKCHIALKDQMLFKDETRERENLTIMGKKLVRNRTSYEEV